MRSRTLGTTGIRVSELGFGTWAIGGDGYGMVAYGPTRDDESLAALRDALDLGCTFFDTSNLYGWGHAEDLIGRAFERCRDSVVIATKAGYASPHGRQDFTAVGIRASVEGSLQRLRTDYIDLLQLHNPLPGALEDNQSLFDELARLRHVGRIRAVGISARSPDEALLFAQRYEPATLQVNFNLGDLRAWRNGLFDYCRERGIGVIVRSPLAAGFLTGRLTAATLFGDTDHRQRLDAEMRARWLEAVRLLTPVFDDAPDATPAQNALRFCLAFDEVSTVIPGMMRPSDVQEDLAAAGLPRLHPSQVSAVADVYDRLF